MLVGDSQVAGGDSLLLRPCLGRDVAVLSTQVAGLASFGLASVADGDLATVVRVEMSAGGGAVAISRDGLGVDVVHERTALGW